MAITDLQGLELLTFSRYQTRMDCPRKDWYRYENGLKQRFPGKSLSIGSACHKGWETGDVVQALATFDDTYPRDQAEADAMAADRAIVEAILRGSFALWRPPQRCEVQFRVPIVHPQTGEEHPVFTLAGKIDGISDPESGRWIDEYKTSSKLDKPYVDRLALDTQVTLYCYALWRAEGIPVRGVRYRVAKKPSIRQTQKETPAQYRARLLADYEARPDFYFQEFELVRSHEEIMEFESDLWAFCERLAQDRKMNWHPKNTSRCTQFGGCAYLPLCTRQADAEQLYVVAPIHSELDEEDWSDVA